ncbi:MAG: cell wall hydrolase [Piscirickettsiaceae bacterium]|nr:cell wall hydrolase [Piscirickettsiaceae bacterium]
MIDPLTCMAMAIYFEARGEPLEAQMRVADTIMNRVHSKRFPNTVCGVVKQKHQFSFYWDGKPEEINDHRSWQISMTGAHIALEIPGEVGNTCHYARSDLSPKWSVNMAKATHGNHTFYSGGC